MVVRDGCEVLLVSGYCTRKGCGLAIGALAGSGVRGKIAGVSYTEQYDVVVVGAGHAGCEAAMASARMGLRTALFTLNLDLVAQMSCNPAVGGIAKGHLVREIDALGGVMGVVADSVGIQFRLLNTSRGPAVWSPRAQCDKALYRVRMKEMLEGQRGLFLKQAEVVGLIVLEDGRRRMAGCAGLRLRDGREVRAGRRW